MATYTQGENHLTDLSSEEMQALLGADIPKSGREMPLLNVKAVTTAKPAATTNGCSCTCAPTTTAKPTTTTTTAKPTATTTNIGGPTSSLDWRNTAGMVQAVRNQGGCG